MKKNIKTLFKNPIFTFILGAVIFGTISTIYAASLATAENVSYTSSDTSWSVTNLKAALDDLYSKVESKACLHSIFK